MVRFILTAVASFGLVLALSSFSAPTPPTPCYTHCKTLVCPCYPNPPFLKRCVQCLPGSGTNGYTDCIYGVTPHQPCALQCPQVCTFAGSCTC
jgi:hypothetical protein